MLEPVVTSPVTMQFPVTTLATIYRSTMDVLNGYRKRVSENRDVLAASNYARWLNFSGIVQLLRENSNQEPPPLKINGAHLQWTIDDLIQTCAERFRTNSKEITLEVAAMQTLHDKVERLTSNVDLMAGQISRLTDVVASASAVNQAAEPMRTPFQVVPNVPDESELAERGDLGLQATEETGMIHSAEANRNVAEAVA